MRDARQVAETRDRWRRVVAAPGSRRRGGRRRAEPPSAAQQGGHRWAPPPVETPAPRAGAPLTMRQYCPEYYLEY
eukprot:9401912-Pyramimonas_sp.AAC.1